MKHLLIKASSSLVLLLLFISCDSKKAAISPKRANISESVYASGIVKSENQYEVFAKVNAIVDNVFVKEGSVVQKGDPIYKLEDENSKLKSKNAHLLAVANDYASNREKLAEAKKAIDLAQKNLINDSLLLVRQQSLWSQNIGSKISLEEKELNFENAKLRLAKSKVTYNDLKRQLELASSQSKNNLKIAQSIEQDLIVRSAIDGMVYKINVEIGELAKPNMPLAVIGKQNFEILLNIDEFDIAKVEKGQRVIIRMDSYEQEVFEAVINTILPMMNERTRTFKVEALFSQEPPVLYPNLTVEANIIISEKANVLTIPTNYLVNDSSVMLADGAVQKVKIGLKDFNLTEIESGINEKTKIIMPEK